MSRSQSGINAKQKPRFNVGPRMVQWLAFQTVKRKAGDRVSSWILLTVFFYFFLSTGSIFLFFMLKIPLSI